jgi:hypothetical protein
MKKIKMLTAVLAISSIVFCFMVSMALADSIGFDISVPNEGLYHSGTNLPPYLAVTVSRTDITHVTITVTAYSGYYFGGNGFGVNVNGDVTYSDIIVTGGSYTDTGDRHLDGFGDFSEGVGFAGSEHDITYLSFTLTNTSGSWDSVNDVLTETGWLAAAHVFPQGNGFTGYAANGTPQVPEPTTLLLLGLGLVGIAGISRRLKK